jgi:itaconate CoA-transferase
VSRVSNRSAVDARIAAAFARLTRPEATARLRAAQTAFGVVNDIPALALHPALRRVLIDTPSGPARIVAPAVVADDGMRHLGPVPAIGEHSQAIRREFLPDDASFQR